MRHAPHTGHEPALSVTLSFGAQHTSTSGLSLPRESDFFVSAYGCRPGSAFAIQDPSRRGKRRACLVPGVEVPGSTTPSTGVAGLPQRTVQAESRFTVKSIPARHATNTRHEPSRSVMLSFGAKTTHDKRFSAPDISGFRVFTAFSREYAGNKRPVRGIPAGRLVTVVLAPGVYRLGLRRNNISALKRRSSKRGRVMRDCRVSTRPPRGSCSRRGVGGMLCVGAKTTSKQRFSAPDISGFRVFTAFSREYAGNKRPVRGIPAGRLFAVVLAPGVFLFGLCRKIFSALKRRSKQRGHSMRGCWCKRSFVPARRSLGGECVE